MKWILIAWALHADGLPTMPITFSFYPTVVECERMRKVMVRDGRRAVCRESKVIHVGKLQVVG